MDDKGISGAAIGKGPGVGISVGTTFTKTFTVGSLYNWIGSKLKGK